MSLDEIKEVGHNGSFLDHTSTFEHFRSRWAPTIADWESYDDWQDAGEQDITIRANLRFKEILAKAPNSLIDSELEKELLSYIQKATTK